MKNRMYLKTDIKKIILLGRCIFACNILLMIAYIFTSNIPTVVIIYSGLFNTITIGFFIILLFRRVYLPSKQMEELIEQYRNNGMHSINKASDYDLLEETKSIISSLETITIKQKNAEILMKVAEINNLQDQINPHFLYNTLEVIRGEAMLKGETKIAEMTESLANYFRYNISRKDTFVFLKDELKNIMNYFTIQRNRFGKKISCRIVYQDVVKEEIETSYIPKLILQPIIENCIYHGLEMKIGEGKITIHISAADDNLYIDVADDGLGMTQDKLDEINKGIEETTSEKASKGHNGVAMKNIKKRLKLYWENNAYMVTTSDLGYGTEVHLMMPLLYEKKDYMEN